MENVTIPIHLSAFVLTPECAASDGPDRIGILTQPNYMGLRLDEALMQHDLVDHVDFHLTSPAKTNARLTDIGAALNDADPPPYRRQRMGVYLHWSLPRCYRAAQRSRENDRSSGIRPDEEEDDLSTPQFPTVPNRWLVVRRLTNQRSEDGTSLPTIQTWVVESNRVRRIQDIDDTVDIEVEVSNFMRGNTDPSDPDWKKVLERQAEICIGKRNEYSGWPDPGPRWTEQERGVENEVEFMDLTVLSSSNPLFPDYTPHNGSVFSIIDSFKYRARDGTTKYLLEATADYFVIGWNSLPTSDLLESPEPALLKTTLSNLNFSLTAPAGATVPEKERIDALLESRGTTRSIIHGAVYAVPFKWGDKPASKAKKVADKFVGPTFTMEPISAGVTPLDGVITFLRAHKGRPEVDTIFGDDSADEIAEMVLTMADLLYAANDSFNERAKAQDINTYDALYGKSNGSGYQWSFAERSEVGKPPKSPTPEQFAFLLQLNEKQARFDSLERKLEQLRHSLFCQWWLYISDKTNILNTTQAKFRARVNDLAGQVRDLESSTSRLIVDLEQARQNPSFKRVVEDPFYMRKEPTVCIAGLESGWPKDFLDTLPVRVDSILTSTIDGVEADIFRGVASPFPTAIKTTALKLLGECRVQTATTVLANPRKGFQHWGTENPFEPLFLEWEALYYHIDRSKWTVGVRPSPVGLPTSHVRYGIPEILSQDRQNQKDRRWISGRTLILPQPVFSLKVAIQAVLESNDPNSPFKDPATQKELLDGIDALKFMSCPLSGLQEHLLTQVIGTHVKPTLNKPGKTNIPLIPAAQPDIGFTEDVLKLIDSMSDMTPYGNLQDFPATEYPIAPFKSVTHGQLIITKLNIIDKFGQGVALPAPKRKLRVPPEVPESVHPCLSDFLIPDIVNNQLNTVFPSESQPQGQGDWPMSKFLQLTPAINQNTRLNATFVQKSPTPGFPYWNETENDKPESPIFGWIIVNYQDLGLQFFRPDGRFYREVRVGGPNNAVIGSKWLPFDPPAANEQTVPPQLDELIRKMVDKNDSGKFLKSFFHMINGAIRTMPYAPSEYSGYANALVGKPLALVNIGFSLELATPALTAQNTLGKVPVNEQDELSSYRFPIKLGDADRPFDGVVGWFDTDNTTNGRTNWDKVYTYAADPSNPTFETVTPQNFIRLSPHYLDPVTLKATGSDRTFQSYRQGRTAQYAIKTMLVDPYTPIHAYSPILPITSLLLPPWTVQQAMTRMTAFFRLGPSLVSTDVPTQYDESRKVNPDTWATPLPSGAGTQSPAMPAIRLPVTGKKGLWRWLQPYDVPSGSTSSDFHNTRYNEMDVNQEDTTIRKDPPPYTMVEGYLQLARPLLSSDIPAASSSFEFS